MLTDEELARHRSALEALTRATVSLLAAFTLGAFAAYGLAVYLWWSGWQITPVVLATVTFLAFRWLRRRALRLALGRLPGGEQRTAVGVLLRREMDAADPDTVLRELHRQLLQTPGEKGLENN